ncbi:hypothetical protein GCM10027275_36050 [Rhabdobacter roseus]|uniref:Glycosyltransferase RgtA/B/C/D-like domain-containing protein n=1 Tax=Rhabdobacter roseus TaxID=1655419 RepID=A0A840U2B9_9BACT|nr:hypothetical protein [Rhabdobacter roseus]MBB5285989.1 hypothetical protein [Rhabdobacter roseus]
MNKKYQAPIPALAVLGTLLIYWIYVQLQPVYTYTTLDARYDAHQYLRAYAYFKGQRGTYQLDFPYNPRILVPWLAAQVPYDDAVAVFKVLNGIFVVLAMAVLVRVWVNLGLRLSLVTTGLFWLLLHWRGLVRMYLPDPVTVDVPGYFFGALWLFLILRLVRKGRVDYLSLSLLPLSVLATLQKELFVPLVGASGLFFVWHRRAVDRRVLLLFAGSLALALVARFWAERTFPPFQADWRTSSLVTVLWRARQYLLHPSQLLWVPVGWLLAFGGIGLVGFYEWLRARLLSGTSQTAGDQDAEGTFSLKYLGFMSMVGLVLGLLGGGDTVRNAMLVSPFVLTYLLHLLQQRPAWAGYLAGVVSLPLMRLTHLEPDLGTFPEQQLAWCTECWRWAESWPYLLFIGVVWVVFFFFRKYFGE